MSGSPLQSLDLEIREGGQSGQIIYEISEYRNGSYKIVETNGCFKHTINGKIYATIDTTGKLTGKIVARVDDATSGFWKEVQANGRIDALSLGLDLTIDSIFAGATAVSIVTSFIPTVLKLTVDNIMSKQKTYTYTTAYNTLASYELLVCARVAAEMYSSHRYATIAGQ